MCRSREPQNPYSNMALLHRMSGECIKSELDLFSVPLTQTVIEKNGYLEVSPLSAISGSAPLEFFIAGNGDDYVDLNNTMLYLRVKITRPNGEEIAHPAKVGLINYPGATIFSQVDVTLGDRLISQSSSTYPYRCIIESLINYGKDTLESVFSADCSIKTRQVTWMFKTPQAITQGCRRDRVTPAKARRWNYLPPYTAIYSSKRNL